MRGLCAEERCPGMPETSGGGCSGLCAEAVLYLAQIQGVLGDFYFFYAMVETVAASTSREAVAG